MKIRSGFVSNSSSTSFCLFGVYIAGDVLSLRINRTPAEEDDDYGFQDEAEAYFDKLFKKENKGQPFKLDCVVCEDGAWVGADPCNCPDDLTMGEFKDQTTKRLAKALGSEMKKLEFIIEETSSY